MSNAKIFGAFLAGAATGAAIAWAATKGHYSRYYEDLYQEEKESLIIALKGKEHKERTMDNVEESEEEKVIELKSFKDLAKVYGTPTDYAGKPKNTEEKKEETKEKPSDIEVIDPYFFGEYEDYRKISLTHYADGVVMEDDTEEVIDDVENTIGLDSLKTYGQYEDDCVHVRNDRLKCYFEITKDEKTYKELLKEKPYLREE